MRQLLFLLLATLVSWVPGHAQTARQGYVLRVEGRLVFIDLGAQNEVIPDDVFEMVRQETIIHPVTGENLGGEVPLGAVRVVEIFPRVSTAEVVQLEPGVNLRSLDMEAKQGLIRVKAAAPDVVDAVRSRPSASMRRVFVPVRPSGKANPDGALKSVVPELFIGGGTKVETDLPDRTYKLVADPLLLALADTTGDQSPENINSATSVGLNFDFPMSERWTLTTGLELGSQSLIAVGARIFPGSIKGSGAELTPQGKTGEPVLSIAVGRGGIGASTLSPAMQGQLVAQTGLPVPAGFLPDSIQTVRDSLYTRAITDSLRAAAGDSLDVLNGRGLGYAFGVTYPMSHRIVLNAGYREFANLSRLTAGFTYYFRPLGSGDRNPDGVLRSMIARADGIWDVEGSSFLLDLGLTVPVTPVYTAGLGVMTDFSGYARFGVALKGYFRGM